MSELTVKNKNDLHLFGAGVAAFSTVFICFIETYLRMRNPHLKISITLYVACSILQGVVFFSAGVLVAQGNFSAASPLFVLGSIIWVLGWLQVTYHTSYRAAQITLVRFKWPWIVPFVVCLCQAALSGTGAYYFINNFLISFGQTSDPRSAAVTVVESFWYSIIETILFAITQYRIVYIHSQVKKVSTTVKLQLYMKAVSRSVLYSFNVTMMFLSVGNVFGTTLGINSNWTTYGQSITLLILLTDSDRFQETIAVLTGTTDWSRGTRLTTSSTDESAKDISTANSIAAEVIVFGDSDLNSGSTAMTTLNSVRTSPYVGSHIPSQYGTSTGSLPRNLTSSSSLPRNMSNRQHDGILPLERRETQDIPLANLRNVQPIGSQTTESILSPTSTTRSFPAVTDQQPGHPSLYGRPRNGLYTDVQTDPPRF
ncbi:hypothetical protein BJ742DRAFT_34009 [Cladochytrium replicatum]|nr:hypothetical protein BJ742DRAFT_34009 [Cladochytrium replicatum]